jgi:hypothetical protein
MHVTSIINAGTRESGDAVIRTTGLTLSGSDTVVNLEAWTETSGSLTTQHVRMAGQCPGMRNVPVFA